MWGPLRCRAVSRYAVPTLARRINFEFPAVQDAIENSTALKWLNEPETWKVLEVLQAWINTDAAKGSTTAQDYMCSNKRLMQLIARELHVSHKNYLQLLQVLQSLMHGNPDVQALLQQEYDMLRPLVQALRYFRGADLSRDHLHVTETLHALRALVWNHPATQSKACELQLVKYLTSYLHGGVGRAIQHQALCILRAVLKPSDQMPPEFLACVAGVLGTFAMEVDVAAVQLLAKIMPANAAAIAATGVITKLLGTLTSQDGLGLGNTAAMHDLVTLMLGVVAVCDDARRALLDNTHATAVLARLADPDMVVAAQALQRCAAAWLTSLRPPMPRYEVQPALTPASSPLPARGTKRTRDE